ncbi:5650_t:CDS:2 [Cetraspora pellucida]|uniref:5650_t:CDS:1 n=1 Tax=Cetraspora pellucida TaxID=1433469 RepID=A0A9N9AKP0_9GLOM|nr:5650_t:CDS:2 [Cetraspora pellucida]
MLAKAETNRTLNFYYEDYKNKYMYLNCYNSIIVNKANTYKEHAANWYYLTCWNQSMTILLWNLKDKLVANDDNLS